MHTCRNTGLSSTCVASVRAVPRIASYLDNSVYRKHKTKYLVDIVCCVLCLTGLETSRPTSARASNGVSNRASTTPRGASSTPQDGSGMCAWKAPLFLFPSHALPPFPLLTQPPLTLSLSLSGMRSVSLTCTFLLFPLAFLLHCLLTLLSSHSPCPSARLPTHPSLRSPSHTRSLSNTTGTNTGDPNTPGSRRQSESQIGRW